MSRIESEIIRGLRKNSNRPEESIKKNWQEDDQEILKRWFSLDLHQESSDINARKLNSYKIILSLVR